MSPLRRRPRRGARFLWLAVAACVLAPVHARAGDRYALIVTGAAGGPEYGAKYTAWRAALVQTLTEKFGYAADHVSELFEDGPDARKATRANVRAALTELRRRTVEGDVTLILLIGHGTADSDEAKFNLVGPDMAVDEWAALVKALPGRVVFVNASSGSFPFLAALAGKGRVVLTANDSAAQQFETVFPEYFVKAFADEASDADKNGKVSLLEAFNYASAQVKAWFEQKGQLATEHALLDDTGTGIGREADAAGGVRAGQLAQITYLQPDVPPGMAGNPELANLMRRRVDVENRLDLLKGNKGAMAPERYDDELERLLLEIARIDRQLRAKT